VVDWQLGWGLVEEVLGGEHEGGWAASLWAGQQTRRHRWHAYRAEGRVGREESVRLLLVARPEVGHQPRGAT